ncbi:hypothetical protein [Nitrosomonas communis]|uniref:Uncharacterized protein n=1 Tax=Nitrosomonas communis TaxID=44574 RepID=A0A1I4VEE4_9PROT|nr:hypothetical protein [Nitrosomonas communis]SFM99561.1 hypothetical protein SAMN05421863_10816 [Nitrosomonas communis]
MKKQNFFCISAFLSVGLFAGATLVSADETVTIKAKKFSLANFVMPAGSTPGNIAVSTTQPSGITKSPTFKGTQQYYGQLDLGDPVNPYYFALDLKNKDGKDTFVMYFDKNHNGDLTDDGDPLKNQGDGSGGPGGFATTLTVKWSKLIADPNDSFGTDPFSIWFFSNSNNWSSQKVSHYSRTQLKGSVTLGSQTYPAYLVDSGYNDANLINDGVIIDLNKNGKYDQGEGPFTSTTVNGKTYNFNIAWK